MKRKFAPVLFLGLALGGCSTTATFFPVEGPLAQNRPLPEILAKIDGIAGNHGEISLTLPGSTDCRGKWSSAAGAGVTIGAGSLLDVYGQTYGMGYSVSSGAGQNPGQAFMTCSDGRSIDLDFVTGAGTANGFGIAKDTAGNIYRVLF